MFRDRFAPGDRRANETCVEPAKEKALLQPAWDRFLRGLQLTEKEVVRT
jgi:hypothetical protein